MLGGIRTALIDDPQLRRLVNFRITDKNQGDKNRFKSFYGFKGTDEATRTLHPRHLSMHR